MNAEAVSRIESPVVPDFILLAFHWGCKRLHNDKVIACYKKRKKEKGKRKSERKRKGFMTVNHEGHSQSLKAMGNRSHGFLLQMELFEAFELFVKYQ